MKVWTLIENTSCSEDYIAEHGLSLYIETNKHKILFDTGQTAAFIDNAVKLGIDLSQIDMVILSHGHYDHSGGLKAFLSLNQKAKVYANHRVFGQHYNGQEKYIGVDPSLKMSDRLILVEDQWEIDDELSLFSCNDWEKELEINSFGLNIFEDGSFHPDQFFHEQYLLCKENGKRILFSGCSHKGILNIEKWFTPDVLIGGFHLKKLDPNGDGRKVLQGVAERLLQYETVYYTGHCTGEEQYQFLKERMNEKLFYLSTGQRIEL